MGVPDRESLMLPALAALGNGKAVHVSRLRDRVAASAGLTPQDRSATTAYGNPQFVNRLSWAIHYVMHAGLVERVRRGTYQLTPQGGELLAQKPAHLDVELLREYPAFRKWEKSALQGQRRLPERRGPFRPFNATDSDPDHRITDRDRARDQADASRDAGTSPAPQSAPDTNSLHDAMRHLAQESRSLLEARLLDRIQRARPEVLERAVFDLLAAMGYGLPRSDDGGVSDTIKEDPLGFSSICWQAKTHPVGEGALRDFVDDSGSASKGVLVTTSTFTPRALAYAARAQKRIVLIDGAKLASLMIEYGVGVQEEAVHVIHRLDQGYFA